MQRSRGSTYCFAFCLSGSRSLWHCCTVRLIACYVTDKIVYYRNKIKCPRIWTNPCWKWHGDFNSAQTCFHSVFRYFTLSREIYVTDMSHRVSHMSCPVLSYKISRDSSVSKSSSPLFLLTALCLPRNVLVCVQGSVRDDYIASEALSRV